MDLIPALAANTLLDGSIPRAKRKPSAVKINPILVIVGMGQEHRLGRWLKIKGEGVVNGAFVAAFVPRT
jgi:ribosomal RNA-processing protein 9